MDCLIYRPILNGEELTISYMSPLRRRGFDTRESRRSILFQEFGFACYCEACEDQKNHLQDSSAGKKEDIKGGAIGKEKTNKSISYPWKQSVHLKSPNVKTFFHSPRHVINLISGAHKSQMLNEREEQSVIVPKGVVITRIES